ncbi:MAG: hypothetical protein JNK82_32720 [Myxococcaceae bacterium]|nr:hypothetical protein [Myxococcaceae bacterium]
MNLKRSLLVTLLVGCTSNVGTPGPVDPEVKVPDKTPAVLGMTASTTPAIVSVGQKITLTVTVMNSGEATATQVVPTTPVLTGAGFAVLEQSPNPADIAGAAAADFTFVYLATDSGPVSFEVGVEAVDTLHDLELKAGPTTASVIIESAAMLMVESLQAPAAANVGEELTVKMLVTNGGHARATTVKPETLVLTGTGAATLVLGPEPVSADLAQGETATFTFRYRATAAGSLVLSGGARGTDANSSLEVVAESMSSATVQLETPAKLEVVATLPAQLQRGMTVVGTVRVTNTGTSLARRVAANPALPASVTVSGDAVLTFAQAALPVDVPGGATVAIPFTATLAGTGAVAMTVKVRGTDAASNADVESALARSNDATVTAPSGLAITSLSLPTSITRGQLFNVTMVVRNTTTGALTGVRPMPAATAFDVSGGAAATAQGTVAAQDVAAGATATFTMSYRESGTQGGTLVFNAGARGTAAGGATVNAAAVESNLGVVVMAPALVVESITVPARISRGQAFTAAVVVRNSGGAMATQVSPTLDVVGGPTGATAGAAQVPVDLAAGARATFSYALTENGTGAGSMRLTASAQAIDESSGEVVYAPQIASPAVTVQEPAELNITAFTVPAAINRGTTFAVSMTVANVGQATAMAVIANPTPPTATLTGGVQLTAPAAVTPLVIAGGANVTFTWVYTENGTAPGTVVFRAGVVGRDQNSNATLTVAARATNSASVSTPTGCNGSALYAGFGGRSLDADRLDRVVNTDRRRVKPYAMLPGEYQRVLNMTPAFINGQGATFNAQPARWFEEQQLSAISMYQAFTASFQGCLTLTSTGAQYAANPTAATAATECTNFQRRFWSRTPTAAETQACVTFATGTANNDAAARRRWAYACAAVLSSAGFLTH